MDETFMLVQEVEDLRRQLEVVLDGVPEESWPHIRDGHIL